ncbi:MAG: DUF4331 family protein [Ginsengibacter sp.]
MKKILNLFTAILVCLALNQTTVLASSHREAPLIAYDPLADNTDLYAFRSPCDTNNVVLIANYIPFELPQGGPNFYSFGENIRYEIHVDNDASTTGDDIVYRFTFQQVNEDPTTFFNIRLGKQNLKTTYTLERGTYIAGVFTYTPIITNGVVPPNNIGPRSIENSVVGLGTPYDTLMERAVTMATTGEKVFAGPVDDPFFVDLGGAFDLGGFRIPGRDGLAKYNVHSLVVEVPISTLQKTGKTTTQASSILDADFIIGVYATASRPQITTFDSTGGKPIASGSWVQVSRLGMPLTNEVIIPIGQKDKWNSTAVNSESEFVKYFQNPELALYMDDSQFGPAVPGLDSLRIQSNSLQQGYDFRNGKPGLFPLKGNAALAGTALEDGNGGFGTILLPNDSTPRSVDLLPIFYTGVPNLRPYQLFTGKAGGSPLAAGKPFINNFLPTLGDMLRLNMAVPVTPRNDPDFSTLGLVGAAVLGLTDARFTASGTALQFIPNMDGFPNGRRLEDDVTTIELQAVGGVVLAAIGLWYDDYTAGDPNPVTPNLLSVLRFNAGVTQNDTAFKPCFPYVQTPWRAFRGAEYVGPTSFDPLPVTFVEFTASKTGNQVQLQWQVSNEINNDYYDVEQSLGAGVWIKIGTVRAKGGSTNNYQLLHSNPSLSKSNFYRIKQVDKDGRFVYSPIRLVKFTSTTILTISPNPASDYINIYSTQNLLNIHIYDMNGKKMLSQRLTDGSAKINVSRFSKGVYTIVAENNGVKIQTTKIVKQ